MAGCRGCADLDAFEERGAVRVERIVREFAGAGRRGCKGWLDFQRCGGTGGKRRACGINADSAPPLVSISSPAVDVLPAILLFDERLSWDSARWGMPMRLRSCKDVSWHVIKLD